jgi:hypothetical protein
MCGMGGTPKAESPAPPPAPPMEAPIAPVIDETADKSDLASKRKGRNSLRIDLASASSLGGGSGLSLR